MSKVSPNSNYEVEKIAFKDTSLGYLQAQSSKSELFSLIHRIYVEIRIFQIIYFIYATQLNFSGLSGQPLVEWSDPVMTMYGARNVVEKALGILGKLEVILALD